MLAAGGPPLPNNDFATVETFSTGTKREDFQVHGLNNELCPEEVFLSGSSLGLRFRLTCFKIKKMFMK